MDNDNSINEEVKLKEFTEFGSEYDYVACFDENGSSSALYSIFEKISKHKTIDQNIRYFTLTCCLFSKNEYLFSKKLIEKLKKQYFKGESNNVVLHTRDIKKRNKPFNFKNDKKYDKFIISLSTVIDIIQCRVISITFDLISYVNQGYMYDPYDVAIDIILKIIINHISKDRKVAIVFESRGKVEDKELYKHLFKVINVTGVKNTPLEVIKSHFSGIFFNKKISIKNGFAYPGIEMADLCSYPIHRFMRYGREAEDFAIVKKKIIGYSPTKSKYIGMRYFPKKWEK